MCQTDLLRWSSYGHRAIDAPNPSPSLILVILTPYKAPHKLPRVTILLICADSNQNSSMSDVA